MKKKSILFALIILFVLCILLFRVFLDNLSNNISESESINDVDPIISIVTLPEEKSVEEIHKAYIVGVEESRLLVLINNQKKFLPVADTCRIDSNVLPGEICDLILEEQQITEVRVFPEIMRAVRILGITEQDILLENIGMLPLADDLALYIESSISQEVRILPQEEIPIGYSNVSVVLSDGKVAAIVAKVQGSYDSIRVLLRDSNFESIYHDKVEVTCTGPYLVKDLYSENAWVEYEAGEIFSLDNEGKLLDNYQVQPKNPGTQLILSSITRKKTKSTYSGVLEIHGGEKGYILINELPLETYLRFVVPSEMPASYPLEGLKAQAICARNYAYLHMLKAAYREQGAHLDDSTAFQVYNNIDSNERTDRAIADTAGKFLLTSDNKPAETYYYSTSCGMGGDADVWRTIDAEVHEYLKAKRIAKNIIENDIDNPNENTMDDNIAIYNDVSLLTPAACVEEDIFAEFITNKYAEDFEAEDGWYRWKYSCEKVDETLLFDKLREAYIATPELILTLQNGEYISMEIGQNEPVEDLQIVKRLSGGAADELLIRCKDTTYKILSGTLIRRIMNIGDGKVIRQDGSVVNMPTLLPSAFFVIDKREDIYGLTGFTLIGGGFGHGVGLSQNAAKNMANAGMNAEEILEFFYDGCLVSHCW